MKPSRIFWGTLFAAFGILLLIGRNFDLQFDAIWRFWPLALVFIGLAMMLKQPKIRGALAGLAALGIALLLFGLVTFEWLGPNFHISVDNDEKEDGVQVQEFSEPLAPAVQRATLRLEAAAGTYTVDSGSGELLHASVRSSIGGFLLDRESTADDVRFFLHPEQKSVRVSSVRNALNEVKVKIHPAPMWDIDFDIGAAKMECDFSRLRVQSVHINAGAASLKLKLGTPEGEMHVKVSAGASTMRISVPESAGCEVRVDGGLSSKKLAEFDKVRDGLYQTANFAQEPRKIYIDVDAGVSSFRVVRY
jgi:hypothetical protein